MFCASQVDLLEMPSRHLNILKLVGWPGGFLNEDVEEVAMSDDFQNNGDTDAIALLISQGALPGVGMIQLW